MTERPDASPWRNLVGTLFASAALALSPQVFAQESDDEDEEEERQQYQQAKDIEEITVTGSRIQRDTYSSVSPLQIISGQISREVGLLDASKILQESTSAAGQQIDLTFGGFVLDSGPGQTNVNLRGLGGARTLVLINGRRVAPGGVEGAPTTADLGLIPASLVQQYDVLLDGASSIYGSDAIGGVVNVVLRKDFDGLELEGFTSVPQYDNGIETTLRAAWGKNFDRGFISIGAERTTRDNTLLADRPWTERCSRNIEIDENGQIRSQNVWREVLSGMPWDDCATSTNFFTNFGAGANLDSSYFSESLFYTPGQTNTGIPNWSDWSEFLPLIDLNEDGINDINFRDYTTSDKDDVLTDLFSELETTVVAAFGEYTFEGDMNITPFFEFQWAERKSTVNSGAPPLFPAIPANNPFNPCNPNQPNGVDCGLAQTELLNNPVYNSQFLAAPATLFGLGDLTYADICPLIGFAGPDCSALNILNFGFGTTGTPSGPTAIGQHIAYIEGDRNNAVVELPQTRVVLGVSGDLPMINFGSVRDFSFEVVTSFSESSGTSVRRGIREDRLDLALGWYSPTGTPCETGLTVDPRTGREYPALEADAAPGCVPVNLFAPSVLDPIVNGQFATQAETDYVFGTREFKTDYEQSILTAFLTGDLFELPGGTVSTVLGIEYRHDRLDSIPNTVAADGLFFGFSVDEGATGERDVREGFMEVELPLLAGVTAAEELTLNMSGRWTDDEYYGAEWTESAKLGWRPVNNILIRGTYGTSFRQPNLRELFLAGQTGFLDISDPCYIPLSAFDPLTEEYDPTLDERDEQLLANCLAQGVDPTQAGIDLNGDTNYNTEIRAGGALDLLAEEAESWTAGFVWEYPGNEFDLRLGATYYEIEITNSIIEPSPGFIISDCFFSPTGNSPFCSRITRDLSDPTDPRIQLVDGGFINRDNEGARGVDVNLTYIDTLTIADRPFELTVDINANRQLSRSTLFTDEVNGTQDFQEFVGEFGFPTWRARGFFRLSYDDWNVNWETNYIGSMGQDLELVDSFQDAINGISDTCFGPPQDVLCRDYADVENYFQHALSVYWRNDNWTIGGGVRNVFNEAPPQISPGATTVRNNTPLGMGYDLIGRRYFFNVQYNFDSF